MAGSKALDRVVNDLLAVTYSYHCPEIDTTRTDPAILTSDAAGASRQAAAAAIVEALRRGAVGIPEDAPVVAGLRAEVARWRSEFDRVALAVDAARHEESVVREDRDAVAEERDRLRAQVEDLIAQAKRLESQARVDHDALVARLQESQVESQDDVQRLREESARKTCDLIEQTRLTVAEAARAGRAEAMAAQRDRVVAELRLMVMAAQAQGYGGEREGPMSVATVRAANLVREIGATTAAAAPARPAP